MEEVGIYAAQPSRLENVYQTRRAKGPFIPQCIEMAGPYRVSTKCFNSENAGLPQEAGKGRMDFCRTWKEFLARGKQGHEYPLWRACHQGLTLKSKPQKFIHDGAIFMHNYFIKLVFVIFNKFKFQIPFLYKKRGFAFRVND